MENMTIKRRAARFGLECPGDGVAASLLEGGNRSILGVLGGGQQGIVSCNYRSDCTKNSCLCKKANWLCSSRCHMNNNKCKNNHDANVDCGK